MDDTSKCRKLEKRIKELEQAARESEGVYAALRESEEKFHILADSTPAGILLYQRDRCIYANGAAEAILDCPAGGLIGMNMLDFIHPDHRELLTKRSTGSTRGDEASEHHEIKVITKVGTEKWVDLSVALTELGGRRARIITVIDITRRIRSEEVLRESEKRFRLITEKMTDIVWITDMNLRTLYVTPSILNVLGFTPEERMSQTVDEQLTPESLSFGMKALADELAHEAEGTRDPERNATLVLEYYHRDGSTVWMETAISGLRDEQGALTGLLGVSRDVTENKLSQDALRASRELYTQLVNTIPDIIAQIDMEGTILFMNDYALAISGYAKDELVGKNILLFVDPGDRQRILESISLVIRGESRLSNEYRFVMKDGRKVDFEVNAGELRGDDGVPKGIVSVCRDITERKRLEEERKKLEQQLFQSQKMDAIGQLAGGVAHDFNNMLSIIIGNADIAMCGLDSPEVVFNSLEAIMKAGKRSAELTGKLLAFARKQTISPRVVNLNDLIDPMLKMLRRLIDESITLSWRPTPELWNVRIDPSQLDQVLINLVVNARDAMNGGGGEITITTHNRVVDEALCSDRPDCEPGEYISLTVRDNGCGMDGEILASIFEPFFTTKHAGRGTGLGLATVYGIVKQNDGFITVESAPDRGTAFEIYLPRESAETPEPQDDSLAHKLRRGTETVLIVEDDEAILQLGTNMLEMLGYTVLSAGRTDEALALAEGYKGTIDLLLTDVIMPEMNGRELRNRIVESRPELRCLYMSGYTADVIAGHGMLEEGTQFIPKPFSLQELAARVREVLDQKA
ncbi:MAG: PAS domain S-box protein [Spirochaetes bacterium]|nr:PAS domain S-box protein [Spirochaetota bacterium]